MNVGSGIRDQGSDNPSKPGNRVAREMTLLVVLSPGPDPWSLSNGGALR